MGTILVVDDDRLLRESLMELISDLGCLGIDAADGNKALQLFMQHSFDLVVSDVDMPDMSGFELLARLQDLGSLAPLILVSARADEQLSQAAQTAGATCLFPKPVPVQAFRQTVSTLLRL